MKNAEDSRRLSDAGQRASQEHARLTEQIATSVAAAAASRTSGINVHDKENVMNLFEDKLEMKVSNIAMALSMSSVTGLADLAEDEIIPKPIPMQVREKSETVWHNISRDRNPLIIYCLFFDLSQVHIVLFQIYLENISLRLNEDRPPNNITSPGPIPIDLNISKLRIDRDTSGVFHIEPVGE